MKKILKKLLDGKESLCKTQRLFTKTLENQYSCLVLKNTDDCYKSLSDELEFLLSSTVKYKTGRIVIKAPHLSWRKEVILTRSPGLKSPYQSYSALSLLKIGKIDKDFNLIEGIDEYGDSIKKIGLGILKKSKKIDQEKLKTFYEFLQEAITWKKTLDKFVNPDRHNQEDKIEIPVGEHIIKILSDRFDLGILKPRGERNYGKFETIESSEIVEYTGEGLSSEISYQEELMKFLKHFKEFDKALKNAERTKTKLIKQAKELTKRLKEYNKPFKILNKLLKD